MTFTREIKSSADLKETFRQTIGVVQSMLKSVATSVTRRCMGQNYVVEITSNHGRELRKVFDEIPTTNKFFCDAKYSS